MIDTIASPSFASLFGYLFVSFLDINIFEYSFVSKIYIRHTLVQIAMSIFSQSALISITILVDNKEMLVQTWARAGVLLGEVTEQQYADEAGQ